MLFIIYLYMVNYRLIQKFKPLENLKFNHLMKPSH